MSCGKNVHTYQLLQLLMIAGLIGVSSSGTMLSIPNDNWQIECNSSVVLTCTLQTQPMLAMSWLLNGETAVECSPTSCDHPVVMPSHYVPTVGNGTVYFMRIDPIKLTDNYSISCTDGSESRRINTTVNVPVKPSEFTVSTKVQSDQTIVTVLTNCMFAPMENLKLKLQYQKGSNNIVAYDEVNPSEVIACSSVDNPNCGGNSTGRAKAIMTIHTEQTGTSYPFQLVVIRSNTDLTPVRNIGNFTIKGKCNMSITPIVRVKEHCRFRYFL